MSSSAGAGVSEIKSAIRETLESTGLVKEVKAKIRAGVFASLEDRSLPAPERPHEVALAAELISDYLKTLSFDSSANVFSAESGHEASSSMGRVYLAQQLGLRLVNDDGEMPLLVLIIQMLESRKLQAAQDYKSS